MPPVVGPVASRSCADKSRHCEERSDEAIQGRRHRVWIASSQTLLAMTKGKRNAERRCSVTAVPHGTARALRGALASRRSTKALAAATERHRSARATRLPGYSFGAHTPIVRKMRASQHTTRNRRPVSMRHSRALPAPCCPSPARLHPQSGHDAVRACLAQAAREWR
jgi:hypothetical protein